MPHVHPRPWSVATLLLPTALAAVLGVGALVAQPAAAPAPRDAAAVQLVAVGAVTSAGGSSVVAAPAPSPQPGTISVNLNPANPDKGKPSQTIVIILLLTVLSVAPALLVLVTSFTKIIVVLSLLRNALGTPTIPPNQVLAGLALFLSIFVMTPVLTEVNDRGLQPYLKGDKSQSVAYRDGVEPLRDFMLKQTRKQELATMVTLSKQQKPATPKDVPLSTLIPAFVLSELKSAFIIGFVIFIPFLIIDLVISSSLMSMGMMMLPPVLISLPFKLLLFVMVDGWDLVAKALVQSYA